MLEGRVARLRVLLGLALERPGGMYPVLRLATRDVDDEERAAMQSLVAASPLAAVFDAWTAKPRDEETCVRELSALEPALANVHQALANSSARATTSSEFCALVDAAFPHFAKDEERACLMRGAQAWGLVNVMEAIKVLGPSEVYENLFEHDEKSIKAMWLYASHIASLDCPELVPYLETKPDPHITTPPPPPPPTPLDEPKFRSTAGLRDALLASYPDGEASGVPYVLFYSGRELDAYPGWRWLCDLVRRRSDWWPALGAALQHATADGGHLARTALADFHQNYPAEALPLVRWSEPIARRYPDTISTFLQSGRRLIDIVGEQSVRWDATHDGPVEVDIFDGERRNPVRTRFRTVDELEAALRRCAKIGMPQPPAKGPWSWIANESLSHPWLLPMMPEVCVRFAAGSDIEVRAMLDYFVDGLDLWRYIPVFEEWTSRPPAWWNEPARKRRPRGMINDYRWYQHHESLGAVVRGFLFQARLQEETAPIVDLEPLFD